MTRSFLAAGALLLGACSNALPDLGDDAPFEAVARAEGALAANAASGRMWPGRPVVIPVCWENPGASTSQRRNWVRDAVKSTWQRYARINFTQWDTCTPGEDGIHVQIVDAAPSAPGGFLINGVDNGVKLNLSFVAWQLQPAGQPNWCTQSNENLQTCIRAVAIHEFGHVLGFYHEEQRSDYDADEVAAAEGIGDPRPGRCNVQVFNPAPDRLYGAYDFDSVMSYCGTNRLTDDLKTQLSPGDIAAVQRAYGRRIPGSLVSPRGHCVSSKASLVGNPAFLWECDEALDDQEWKRDAGHLYLSPNRCLDKNSTGNGVSIQNCSAGDASQEFSFEHLEVRGWGGLCLELENGNAALGTNIRVATCDGGVDQQWSISDSGEIRYGDANSQWCATSLGNVFLWQCGFPAFQQFDFTSAGQMRVKAFPDQCADVAALLDSAYTQGFGLPTSGANVQQWDCLPAQFNQKWNFSGQLANESSGECLGRASNSESDGTPMIMSACRPTQVWDYYFHQ